MATLLEKVSRTAEEFRRNTERSLAVRKATSELELDLHSERIVIELAIKGATTQVEVDAKSPEYRERFEKALMRLDALDQDKPEPASIAHRRAPSFDQVQLHADPDINKAIREQVDRLRSNRQAVLTGVRAKLTADAELRNHFLKRLHELNADHYLPGLDPTSALSRR
ncbi:hypothetical protein [Stenotrophomonas sp. Ker107b]